MKQTVLALTSLLAANLGFSQAQAAAVATDFVNDNAPNNLSVKQQKAVFAFSQDRASLTMALIERWSDASQAERQTLMTEFVDAFFAAVKAHPDADAIVSEVGSSLLMADTLGNAKYLVAEKAILSPDALDRAVEEVKASLMRVCYDSRSQIVVPYIPQRIAWGQHGQHFPRSKGGSKPRPKPKGGKR